MQITLGAMEATKERGVGLGMMLPMDQPGPRSTDSEKGSGRSADTEKVGEEGLPQHRRSELLVGLMHAADFFHINIAFFYALPTPCYILIVALRFDNSEWCFLILSTAFKMNCIEMKALS